MSIGTALIGLAMLVVVSLIVTQPLQNRSRRQQLATSAAGSSNYDTTLLALRDLEFDHDLGVVDAEEYTQLRAQLMSQAAQALHRNELTQQRVHEAIETAVHARRSQKNLVAPCSACQETLHIDDKFCPHCGVALSTTCPACQQPVAASDKFCASCGMKLM